MCLRSDSLQKVMEQLANPGNDSSTKNYNVSPFLLDIILYIDV